MKIAFTSCMDADDHETQPVWAHIQAQQPDALLLLGDLIYMDWDPTALFDESPVRRRILRHPERHLPEFAREMHHRYAMQWAVPEFQALVRDFVGTRGLGERLFVTWDDHDFAWNNAHGGGAGARERHVSAEVAGVARRLFNQFVGVLRNPPAPGQAYPALEQAGDAVPALPVVTKLEDVPLMLLDQRSWRTHLQEQPPLLLGPAQQQRLWEAVAAGRGLLVVAGASPMRHDHGRREQGWRSRPDKDSGERRAYEEYQGFIDRVQQAQRAVLYLAGDIHRNAYGGPVEPGSGIVQVVSSGAARGGKADGHFGLVTLQPGYTVNDGQVRIQLFDGDEAAYDLTLELVAGQWQEPPDGECAGVPPVVPDPASDLDLIQDELQQR